MAIKLLYRSILFALTQKNNLLYYYDTFRLSVAVSLLLKYLCVIINYFSCKIKINNFVKWQIIYLCHTYYNNTGIPIMSTSFYCDIHIYVTKFVQVKNRKIITGILMEKKNTNILKYWNLIVIKKHLDLKPLLVL